MTARDHRSELPVGTVLGEAYRLVRRLADGGMGTVYEAEHLRLGKRCAVKVMSPDLAASRDALARFHREVEITSRLNHPHIVQVMDFGTTAGGAPFLVMEYLDGEDLSHRLRRSGRMTPGATVHVVKQIASALAATHAGGIVHRDLKPGNIFLIALAGGGEADSDFVKVVDFGISKVKHAGPRLTRASVLMGTPQYMPPEQASGRIEAIDHRSDQWALAVIAWEMLAGRGPFSGKDVTALLYQIVHQDPLPAAARAAGFSPGLEDVLRRALSKRQRDRYGSITAFSRAFEAAVTAPAGASVGSAAAGSASGKGGTSPWRLGTIFRGRGAPAKVVAPVDPVDSTSGPSLLQPLTRAAATLMKAIRPAPLAPALPAAAPPVPLLKTLLGALTPRRLPAPAAILNMAPGSFRHGRPRRRWLLLAVALPALAAVLLYPRGRAPTLDPGVASERAASPRRAAGSPQPGGAVAASTLDPGSRRAIRAATLEPMLLRFFCAADRREAGQIQRTADFGKEGCPSLKVRTPAERAIAQAFSESRPALLDRAGPLVAQAQKISSLKERRRHYGRTLLKDPEARRLLLGRLLPALLQQDIDCPDCLVP